MKKILISISLFFIVITTSVYAYSSGFSYMVNAMNIETVNVNGLILNEDVYEKYNLFCYGSPNTIVNKYQRWKNTETGNWTLNGGPWKGTGTRGEYWILGEDYSGRVIHNEIFPDDYTTGTSPVNWKYRVVKDSEESWNDTSKYQYDIQKEYMLSQKLSRFGITYDITALDIGLDKAKVENYATWGSAGSIYTEKPGEGNIYWVATFSIPPMSANAKLNSVITLPHGNEYTIAKDEEYIEIPLQFGSYVDGLSEYAKPEHVKIIESQLNVNGISKNIVSGSKTISISKDDTIVINKSDYEGQDKVTITLECNSFLATCFVSDPIMYASKSQSIIINIENEENNKATIINDKEAPTIYSCLVQRVVLDSRGKEELVNLYVTKNGSRQFICAGQVIKIKVKTSPETQFCSFDFAGKSSISTLDSITKRFEWDEPIERGEKTRYSSLKSLEKSYTLPRRLSLKEETDKYKIFTATYVIPYGTTQTLHSWNSLRELSQDAFKIDESKLFTRKEASYRLVIKASTQRRTRTKTYSLDVAERWDELYNRDISKYIK